MSLYSNKLGAVGYCYDTPGPYLGFYKCVWEAGGGGGGGGVQRQTLRNGRLKVRIFSLTYTHENQVFKEY